MWKWREIRVDKGWLQAEFQSLSSQLQEMEARIKALESRRSEPETVARLNEMQITVENLVGDWATVKGTLNSLYGRITKREGLAAAAAVPAPAATPATAEEVMELARQKGIIR